MKYHKLLIEHALMTLVDEGKLRIGVKNQEFVWQDTKVKPTKDVFWIK